MPVARARLGLFLALAVVASVFSFGGFAQAQTAAPPFDYMAQAPHLSQPIYPETISQTTKFPTSDGETIHLTVNRPDPALYGEGPWPVILEASPYHGTLHIRTGTRVFPDPIDEYGRQLGITGYFVPRGYAVAMMDLRGTGRSTGCLDHLGAKDGQDMKEVIEWLGTRPWSNGRVGMTGHSYVGSTPIVAAAQNPPHLKTIVPSAGLASMYDHQFQMGVPYNLQWVGPMAAYEMLGIDRDVPAPGPVAWNEVDPVGGGKLGDNWNGSPNTEFGCGMRNSAITAGSGQVTGQYEAWHAARDWADEALAADIPIFMVHGTNDNAARIPAAEWFFGNRYMHPGDKVWLGQWDHGSTNGTCGSPTNARVLHPNCRFDQWKYALHAWFDHHLMQRSWTDANGVAKPIETGPAVEVFLNGTTAYPVSQILDPAQTGAKVYTSNGWAEPTQQVTLYPDTTGNTLHTGAPTTTGSRTLNTADAVQAHTGNAAVQGTTIATGSLVYTSDPMASDTLFLGIPKLDLHAAIAGPGHAYLIATLSRREGTNTEVINTCAIEPLLREGIDKLTPVTPEQEMSLPMQCFTMAHWVPAGQRLVLTIATTDPHHATFGAQPRITVFTGADDTKYTLPVVPAASETLYNDIVPLRESVTPVTFPVGPAQPGYEATVAPAPSLGALGFEPFVAPVEFDIKRGFDNKVLTATATATGDVDLYLQQSFVEDEWVTIDTGTSGGSSEIDGEVLTTNVRQQPGHYRILVVGWADVPTDVQVAITFQNQQGVSGGIGSSGTVEAGDARMLGAIARTTGDLPLL